MTKAKILLSAVCLITTFFTGLAMRAQKRMAGSLFCTKVYGSTLFFQTRYTTILPTVTLYCSQNSNASKTVTYYVGINA